MGDAPRTSRWRSLQGLGARALRGGAALLSREAAPVDLRILGRTLLHAALVGGLAGLLGAAFFAGLEIGQRVLLEKLAGYVVLRARGEVVLGPTEATPFRPWLLALLPALGGLASGLLTSMLAPEAAGGGGDRTIESYHREGGVIRRRVIPVKAIAAVCTLASGGAGGREGPTMQIGGAIGSLVARYLPTNARERRILLVAGVAAGMAAVFRTPLGAALLAVEFLYRDDFESEALVPAILASVVAYAVVISIFGQTTLFGHPRRFPFVPAHLPLYGLLALAIAPVAALFITSLRTVQRLVERLPGPVWVRPALGGLAMGCFGTALVVWMGARHGDPGHGLGIFGGGYGAAQIAIDGGGAGLQAGWRLVALFLLLALAKLAAASLTIGSGAAAGDLAPSLVMGGLLGGAFGEAASLVFRDPRLDVGAFALVGMGTFYGGIAHAPLSALVLVSELAGSYDLLVPMMLATGIAFVGLRRWSLYGAQPDGRRDSPVHREPAAPELERFRARDVLVPAEIEGFPERTPVPELVRRAAAATAQVVFPVLAADGTPRGLIDTGPLRLAAGELSWAVAADLMVPFASVAPGATLRDVGEALATAGLRQIPVVEDGRVLGYVGEGEIARAWIEAAAAG